MKRYDYLIVGSGLFGSIFAYEANKKGKKCLVIDKRDHIGGNIYCENVEDINGDGVKEYITLDDISVTCNACSEVVINTVHEYADGQLKVKEFYLHSALENYGSSYNTYQQVQAAKQLIYNKYQADEKTLEVRFVNDNARLSESYYVFSLISEPYSSAPKIHSEQLLVEKQTNKLFYMSIDGKIAELN